MVVRSESRPHMRNEGFPHRFDAGALDHSEPSKMSSAALRVSASCGGRASRVQRVAGLSFFGLLIWVGVHPGVLTPPSVRAVFLAASADKECVSPVCRYALPSPSRAAQLCRCEFRGSPVLPLGTRRPKCHPAVVTGHITHGPLCLSTADGKRSACGAN